MKTFSNFIVPVPQGVDLAKFNTVIVGAKPSASSSPLRSTSSSISGNCLQCGCLLADLRQCRLQPGQPAHALVVDENLRHLPH